ncbi:MAG: 3-oxoacyl-[acyl-carrier-protein] synthase III C-terminal domain-containing protein [Desulfuromonadales bacterium]|nr:3-oxoacyl-[acyl-carrier-protein] synthase III C-terminal domain-containing protein [Desulfuromonadales bacterium]
MPKIIAASHALPPHIAHQTVVRDLVAGIFANQVEELERLLAIFDNARIDTRQFMMPLDWYLRPHLAAERTRIYQEEGLKLMVQAAGRCLEKAGCAPAEINQIIVVSSTGHATPTLDAHLINELGLNPTTTRLPLWGLGCAGGAAGLARAADYCRAYPEHRVLVVALECCSLTFMAADVSKKNLVATALFADGAAAALVAGDRTPEAGVRVLASRSQLFPESYRIMGWDFVGQEMQLVLSPRLPTLIRQELRPLIDDFFAGQGIDRTEVPHFITHPGGARIIDVYRDVLELRGDELALTEAALRNHGNVSSVSVLLVLEAWLASSARQTTGYGLLSAFGPGFSAELLLLGVE